VNAIALTITETSLSANILRNDRMKDMMIEPPNEGISKPSEVADMADFLISEKPNLFQDRFLRWMV
jgi:hypothetical protein